MAASCCEPEATATCRTGRGDDPEVALAFGLDFRGPRVLLTIVAPSLEALPFVEALLAPDEDPGPVERGAPAVTAMCGPEYGSVA